LTLISALVLCSRNPIVLLINDQNLNLVSFVALRGTSFTFEVRFFPAVRHSSFAARHVVHGVTIGQMPFTAAAQREGSTKEKRTAE
jgi:hypothetical protein